VERVTKPSEVAVPEAVRRLFEPLTDVGIAMDCTKVPAGVYSSRNTAVALAERAAEPLPTRYMTRSPGVNAAETSDTSVVGDEKFGPRTLMIDSKTESPARPPLANRSGADFGELRISGLRFSACARERIPAAR
jgi:hypothetical protein